MSADIFRWDDFASSGRGLIAGPILPQGIMALREHIASITYKVKNLTTLAVVTDSIDLSYMYSSVQPWDRDPNGFTFLWPASGDLWPNANTDYSITIEFITTPLMGNLKFKLVWRVSAKDPDA